MNLLQRSPRLEDDFKATLSVTNSLRLPEVLRYIKEVVHQWRSGLLGRSGTENEDSVSHATVYSFSNGFSIPNSLNALFN
jgi:hypothetical protein